MTTDARTKIIETIAKLSAMMNPDANAFQGEINNAAAKIQELMDKYSISQAELQAAQVDSSRKDFDQQFATKTAEYTIKGIKAWHWALAKVIAEITHTKNFSRGYGTRHHMQFFGESANSEIASNLFAEWVQIIEAMAISATDDYWKIVMKKYNYAGWLKDKKANGYSDKFMETVPYEERTTYYKISWLDGCVLGIKHAVHKQEEKRSQEVSTALVVYEEKVELAYKSLELRFRTVKVNHARGSSNIGRDQGYEAGSKIKIGLNKVGG